jgi:hypothetical protein
MNIREITILFIIVFLILWNFVKIMLMYFNRRKVEMDYSRTNMFMESNLFSTLYD